MNEEENVGVDLLLHTYSVSDHVHHEFKYCFNKVIYIIRTGLPRSLYYGWISD
jgi:hypothetical protein